MYILFNNGLTADQAIEFLEGLGLTDSRFGPIKENAVGVCSSKVTNNYTLLGPWMLSKDPRISWITCRQECKTFAEFKENVIKQRKQYKHLINK